MPINANHEVGPTMAATQNGRINSITLKCDRPASGGLNEATFWIAFDNVQKNSALHTIFQAADVRGIGCSDVAAVPPLSPATRSQTYQITCRARVAGVEYWDLNPQTPFINTTRQ